MLESGASDKEAQELARHSSLSMTMNTYCRAPTERLAAIAQTTSEVILVDDVRAIAARTGTHVSPTCLVKSATRVQQAKYPNTKADLNNLSRARSLFHPGTLDGGLGLDTPNAQSQIAPDHEQPDHYDEATESCQFKISWH